MRSDLFERGGKRNNSSSSSPKNSLPPSKEAPWAGLNGTRLQLQGVCDQVARLQARPAVRKTALTTSIGTSNTLSPKNLNGTSTSSSSEKNNDVAPLSFDLFTATVGRKQSSAVHYLPDVANLEKLLEKLSESSGEDSKRPRLGKIQSVPNLSGGLRGIGTLLGHNPSKLGGRLVR